MAQPFAVPPEDEVRALNVVGETITLLASKTATHGSESFLQQADEGTGPPPLSLDRDKSFHVVKGNGWAWHCQAHLLNTARH